LVIHVGSGWTSFKNSNPHLIDQLDFTMIKLTPSKSSFWSSRLLNGMMFYANGRGTSPLQPYFHEIIHLHPNFFMKVPNILSLINHHSIFRCGANQVSTFEGINMELQISKLSKSRSKWKMCTPFNRFRWSQATMMSELLWWSLESWQLSQPRQCNYFAKMIWFSCVYTRRLLNGSLLRVHNTPIKIKRS